MVMLRSSLRLAPVALVYLLLVFLTAVYWGRGPSLAASLLSFLALNYFFTIPYGTLLVAATEDVFSLLVFLFVAEMTARLVAQLREREAEARRKAWEASTLYALTHDMNASSRPEEILERAAARIVELVGVGQCSIFLPDDAARLRLFAAAPGARPGAAEPVPADALRVFGTAEIVDGAAGLFLPLTVGKRVVGVLQIVPLQREARVSEVTRRLLLTFAAQAATVIERLRLQREAAEVEVLRKTDELKSALLSAVSHDLRTPLSSIRIAATGLLHEGLWLDDAARRELLGMIDAEAARLTRLVNNLLNLSRIEAGALKPDKELCDLHEVITRAVDGLHDRLGDRRVEIDVPPHLPLVPLDFTEIEDVLINLLENAVRHSPEDTTIRISASGRNGEVIVQMENQGPPVPVEAAAHIFDRFYRWQHDRRGFGLGLAICKGLVEAHGGRIWVERPGEPGARFAFTLPLEQATGARASTGEEAKR
jgi:two-component system sensor histidine kinase KdpD